MRELRVEDALIYLDQVKVEFGDRPHIYNEFLDIMKTFKTQQIDTPGVIRRVSNLFQGNRRLVLGFNTFLPEGYRIEIPMDGNGPPVAVYRAPGSNVAHILRESAESQAVSIAQQQPPSGGNTNSGMNTSQQQQQPPQGQPQQQYHPGGMPASMQGRMPLSPPPGTADHHASSGLPFGPGSAAAAMSNRPSQQQQPSGNHMLLSMNDAGGVALRNSIQQQQQQQSMQMDSGGNSQQQNSNSLPMSQLPGGIAPRKPIMMMGNTGPNNNNMMQQQAAMHQQQQSAMAISQQLQSNNNMMQQHQQMGGNNNNNNNMLSGNGMMQAPPGGGPFGGAMNSSNTSIMNNTPVVPPGVVGAAAPGTTPAATSGSGAQPLEFDHAINYVTTIKRRFASEPETYKKFLEILHTYQKEQRGIKEVLEEVSELFEDHPDLLKEFTFFLPDAVQPTARLQLDQVAKEAEARKRSKAKAAIMNAAQAMQRQVPITAKNDERIAPPSGGPFPQTTSSSGPSRTTSNLEREAFISRGARYGTVLFEPVRPPFKNELTPVMAALKHGRPTQIPECTKLPNTTEEAFFQHVKDHLSRKELASDKPAGTRRHTPYAEFLKCLHLFGAGVLNKEELGLLLKGLFLQGHAPKTGVHAGGAGHNPSIANAANDLMKEFDEILIGRGPYADQQNALKDKSKYGALRIRDFDWNNSTTTQVSPSYVTYPSDYPHALFLSHPGQTQSDAAVLNCELVCVAGVTATKNEDTLGSARTKNNRNMKYQNKRKFCPSIEESDGSKHRCNTYEEVMFRIEDERYELDMAIERNTHALRRIEPFAKEAQAVREQEEKDGQPIGRLRYQLHRSSLNTIHINAIGRIYGDRGDEIIQHLLRNPLIVLPIVYQRLKQKDIEWRNAKRLLTDRWDAICEANYEGSMDTQCYFNRKALEKSFTLPRLLDQCKRASSYLKYPEKFKDHPATRPFAPTFGRRASHTGALLFQPYLEVKCQVDIGHKHALEFIVMKIRHQSDISSLDRERMGRIFAEFLVPWFKYPVHWILQEIRDSFRGKLNPSVTKFISGQRVQTIFGEGTIASFIDAGGKSTCPKYRVKLPFGLGHLSPSAILYAIPSKDAPYVRRDGIMVRDETSYYGYSDSSPKLDSRYQVLFGTEITYQFFRLYLLLCSLLSDIHDHVKKFPPLDNPSDLWVHVNDNGTARKKKSPQLSYTSMQIALRKVIQKEMNHRDFETLARSISRDKVHQIAVLPILIDRCVERLVKIAEEDTLLQLYDYCHGTNIDPVAAKSHCLAIAPDAYYRIQMDASVGNVRFGCLEQNPLLVYPDVTSDDPEDAATAAAGGGGGGGLGDDMDTGDDDIATPVVDMDTDDVERRNGGIHAVLDEDDEEEDRIPPPEPKRTRFT